MRTELRIKTHEVGSYRAAILCAMRRRMQVNHLWFQPAEPSDDVIAVVSFADCSQLFYFGLIFSAYACRVPADCAALVVLRRTAAY